MKNLLAFSFIVFFIISCKSNKADQPAIHEDTLTATTIYAWEADVDDKGNISMKKIESDLDTLDGASLARYVSNEHIKVEFVRTSNDTAFIKIPDANYLTQQMGTTGAQERMATYVYNFTELPGIRYVNFDFEEGDHAQPGTYTRETFVDK